MRLELDPGVTREAKQGGDGAGSVQRGVVDVDREAHADETKRGVALTLGRGFDLFEGPKRVARGEILRPKSP